MNKEYAKNIMAQIVARTEKNAAEIGVASPHVERDGKFDRTNFWEWTSGFWPGLLWEAYRRSKNEKLLEIARGCGDKIHSMNESDFFHLHHDVGFMWHLSSVRDYEITGDKNAANRAVLAANLLAGRYNPAGKFIRAWGTAPECSSTTGWAIIDCSMNLSLLYWASEYTGDMRYANIATNHADTVVEHFIRPDGSSRHICSFDQVTGEFLTAVGGQGNDPDSAWSRGNAWAIYGMALTYRHTGDVKYLDAAKRVAHYFIANLPDDYVCHWDFRVERNVDTPRDTSAAAIAACGFLEIARHVPECEKFVYRNAAEKVLTSLYKNYSNFDDENCQSILNGATGHCPANYNVNVGIIYGDYYFARAIGEISENVDYPWM